jgi:hypothetical protein
MVKKPCSKKTCPFGRFFSGTYFFTPFIMNVERYIKVRLPISDASREFRLEKDVELYTDKVCEPMILFLTEQFDLNPNCLVGDIRSLYQRKNEIVQKKANEMADLEKKENKMQM